jgi:hypothetical protein
MLRAQANLFWLNEVSRHAEVERIEPAGPIRREAVVSFASFDSFLRGGRNESQ